jgi:hypothetical protein
MKERALLQNSKLDELKEAMEQGHMEAVDSWMAIAKELIHEFRSVRAFFPFEKAKRITWYDEEPLGSSGLRRESPGPGRKRKFGDIESRVLEIQERLQESPSKGSIYRN